MAQLPDHAWLRGPNWEITAGQVMRKIYPACQWSCFLDPSILDDSRAIVIDATPAWATTTSTSSITSTVGSAVAATTATTTAVPDFDIPSASAAEAASAPIPVEVGWGDLWWILLTLVGAVYLASRRSQAPIAEDLRVVEDDVSEPVRV